MKKDLLKVVPAVLAMASICVACQNDLIDEPVDDEKFSLTVSIPVTETKLTSSNDDAAINNYQVFLFKDDGTLEDYASQSTSDVTLATTIGGKTVVVVVNGPSLGHVMDFQTLQNMTMKLSDNSPNSFVFTGSTTIHLSTKETTAVTVQVFRKVAKVVLSELNVVFDVPQFSSQTFKVSSVYLINVSAEMPYLSTTDPTLWYNKLGYNQEDDNSLIYDDMGGQIITPDAPYTTQNTFYCFANNTKNDSFDLTWSPRRTRLVVEAMLGDKTYYYPVTLPALEANKIYQAKLTITRPGAETPDSVVDKFNKSFDIVAREWGTIVSVSEDI